jgi:hypothetical protein
LKHPDPKVKKDAAKEILDRAGIPKVSRAETLHVEVSYTEEVAKQVEATVKFARLEGRSHGPSLPPPSPDLPQTQEVGTAPSSVDGASVES